MGIDLNGAQLLMHAKKNGAPFARIATLGRQGIHCQGSALVSLARSAGYELTGEAARRLQEAKYAEELFSLLGAKEIVAIDASPYEGAQIVHNMNQPISVELESSFDAVLDGGTLEHVFELPTGLRNAAQMVKPGGVFMSITIASNFCGHGFYQFSPELFYRFFSKPNGFEVESCILWEDLPGSRFYRVPDPDSIGRRIELTSEVGAYMFIQARRIADVKPSMIPIQSDYVGRWAKAPAGPPGAMVRLKVAIRNSPILWPIATLARKFVQRFIGGAGTYHRQRIRRRDSGALIPLDDLRVLG